KFENSEVVLITGASSGIGEEMAYEAARKGYRLVLCARNEQKLRLVAEKCRFLSDEGMVWIFPMDLSEPENIEEVFERILEKTGRVDVLINNAGFGLTEYFVNADLKRAEAMFRVNVLGVFYLTQLAAIQMAEQKSGHIFFMASMAGKMSTPKSSLYSA